MTLDEKVAAALLVDQLEYPMTRITADLAEAEK